MWTTYQSLPLILTFVPVGLLLTGGPTPPAMKRRETRFLGLTTSSISTGIGPAATFEP